MINIGPHGLDDMTHTPDPAGPFGDRFEIVADRLLPRDVAHRAEKRPKEAGQAGMTVLIWWTG